MIGKKYIINEIFYSPQGEGIRAGTMNIFIRFAGCNMLCSMKKGPKSPGGFDCDTEFQSGRGMEPKEILKFCREIAPACRNIILTGGEPTLQVDAGLIEFLRDEGYYTAIETNGSRPVPPGINWITVSPKVAEHAIRQTYADEVKYVRGYGQALPRTRVNAKHYLISPAFDGTELDRKTLKWCVGLCKQDPRWRLSVQQHKNWKVR